MNIRLITQSICIFIIAVFPINAEIPIEDMSKNFKMADYEPLRIKFALPEGISVGMEFGYVKMLNPELDFNLRGSYVNTAQISLSDIFFYEQLFKRAFPGTDIAKLNYGILIGIGF